MLAHKRVSEVVAAAVAAQQDSSVMKRMESEARQPGCEPTFTACLALGPGPVT